MAVVAGRPVISHYVSLLAPDAKEADLVYVRANDSAGASWGKPIAVDSNGWVGQDSSIAEVAGRPAIAYYDLTNNDLRYAFADR
jgi:hypothetical protein